jgi:hypothetical protein
MTIPTDGRSQTPAEALFRLRRGSWELLSSGAWMPVETVRSGRGGDVLVDVPGMELAYRPATLVWVRPAPPHPE